MNDTAFIRRLAAAFAAGALACATGCSGDASSEPTDLNEGASQQVVQPLPVPPPPVPNEPPAALGEINPAGTGLNVPPPPLPLEPK